MRTQRNTMLAGIAALALLAGSGFASAQEPQNKNAAPKQPQAQEMNKGTPAASKMEKGAPQNSSAATEKSNLRAAQTTNENKAGAGGKRTAQTEQRKTHFNKSAMAHSGKFKGKVAQDRSRMTSQKTAVQQRDRRNLQQRQSTAQQGERNGMQERRNTAQGERTGMKGLQGNASGMNVQFSNEQREQIRTTVLNGPNAPRIGNVDFDVTVGTMIPRGFHAVAVPSTLVSIEPRWRGFRYFVYQNEVVIVNPRDMRIVAVVMV